MSRYNWTIYPKHAARLRNIKFQIRQMLENLQERALRRATQCAIVTFTPTAPASFATTQDVTMACATGSSTIYYTTDGSDPTPASTTYSGAVTLSATTTIRASAYATGYTASVIQTAVYTKT